ncbi:transmembrane epididymal protein 1A-like [Nannospalax galili]|uniref:transmembrane epididymal protein 1A-like n=1 Tax=Nannospalax galili TaxID=1026970 RepID=UPI0004ED2445|nr:transmembrane epididymal protein 1A-like [Nannospalax galili]
MGTLEGHLLPGIALLFYSLYHSVLVSLALLQEQRVLKPPLFVWKREGHRALQQVSYEGVLKVVIPCVGILAEFYYPPGINRAVMIDWEDPQRPFVFKDNWQHFTMYVFFLLSGMVDIVSQSCVAHRSARLERAAEALAFYVLVLLMAAHIENKSALEIRVHILFMVPSFLLAVVLSIEIWVPDHPPLWVFKTWLGLVLSNWMLQLCTVMYSPPTGQPWRADNPVDLSFLTIFFCWHLALGAVVLAAIYGLCSLWHSHRSCSFWTKTTGTWYQPCPTESSGEELEKLRTEAVLQDEDV